MFGECDLIPYDDAGRLGRGFPGGGALGGLGEVCGADVCPSKRPFCGLPSLTSPVSVVASLGACSSPVGAGRGRAICYCASSTK